MKQVTEIIDILSDENVNLENALIKTKVLMHRMGEQEAVQWINRELTGYSDEDDVPEYRILNARPMIRVTNGFYTHPDAPAVTHMLTEEQRAALNSVKMGQSISAIAHMATNGEGSTLVWDIPYAFWGKLSQPLTDGHRIEKAWSEITKSQLLEISTVIRTRLLDFVLKLESKIPSNADISDVKDKAKEIGLGDMFRDAVIGDHANVVVSIGYNNTQNVNYSVVENDLEGLVKLLKENGVSEEDTDALKAALENDEKIEGLQPKEFGPAVQAWVKAMLRKAVEGSWNIGVGAAEQLLQTALLGYLGSA